MAFKPSDINPRRGVARFVLRAPVFLWHVGLGRLPGKRFLLLRHTGRKTGRQRETVLEVMRYDESDNRYIVCSGWGEGSDWYKNLQQRPQAAIVVRGRQMKVIATRLSQSEAAEEIRRYTLYHPAPYRWIREMLLGRGANKKADDFRILAERVPVMGLEVMSENGSLTRPRLIRAADACVRWPKRAEVRLMRNPGISNSSGCRPRITSETSLRRHNTKRPDDLFNALSRTIALQ